MATMTHTIHIPQTINLHDEVALSGPDAHHLIKVVRIKTNDQLKIVDETLKIFEAHVVGVGKDQIHFSIHKEINPPPRPYPIYLCLALLKKEKMEWVIEKATELNIAGVHLFTAKRSVRDELSANKWQRLQKIADEALKQCGRVVPLVITRQEDLSLAVQELGKSEGLHFFCDESAPPAAKMSLSTGKPLFLWIGPEGGWDESERECTLKSGFQAVSLAPLILRAETAALHALSSAIALFESKTKVA